VCEVWEEPGREHISGTPVIYIMKILLFAAEVGLKRSHDSCMPKYPRLSAQNNR